MKYLKVLQGAIKGSLGVQSGGVLEYESLLLIDDAEQLVRTYDPSAKYYKLAPVDVGPAVEAIRELNGPIGDPHGVQ